METVIFAVAGYLIGSIPVAFLLAKRRHGIDLRIAGSGNIGARNAYEVTGNKRTGFAVLVLDMHKGIIPLVILSKLGFCPAIPLVAVTIIIGHCYPVWLRFHGGRGLATGAAIALMMQPEILIIWLLLYFFSGIIRKQVHFQSLFATAGCIFFEGLVLGGFSVSTSRLVCFPPGPSANYAVMAILIILISRHIKPVYELYKRNGS